MTQLTMFPAVDEGNPDGNYAKVDFETDEGMAEIGRLDGEVLAEVAFEEVSAERFEQILDDVASYDGFDDDAEELARELVDDLKEQDETDDEPEPDVEVDETEEDDDTGEVVHVTEDGTEIRIGDRINHPGGGSYKITGREDDHTLRKVDNRDQWGVTVSTAEKDIKEFGFGKRSEVK